MVSMKPTRDQYIDRVFTTYGASHTYDARGVVVYVKAADLDALVTEARELGLDVRRVTRYPTASDDKATARIFGFRRVRGPQIAPTKQHVSLRISRDALDVFRATGDGWQGRIVAAIERAARRVKA